MNAESVAVEIAFVVGGEVVREGERVGVDIPHVFRGGEPLRVFVDCDGDVSVVSDDSNVVVHCGIMPESDADIRALDDCAFRAGVEMEGPEAIVMMAEDAGASAYVAAALKLIAFARMVEAIHP